MKRRVNKTEEQPAHDVMKECAVDMNETTGLPNMYFWLNKNGPKISSNGKSESIGRLMITAGNKTFKLLLGVGKTTKTGSPFLYELVTAQQGQYSNIHPAPTKAPPWVTGNKAEWLKNWKDIVQVDGTLPRSICDYFRENPEVGFETRETDRAAGISKGQLLPKGKAEETATFGAIFTPSEPVTVEDESSTGDDDPLE